jgi:basic membrane protein A
MDRLALPTTSSLEETLKKTTKIVAAFAAATLAFGVAPVATAANSTKACLALDTGGVDDKSFNASAWAGANAAKKANSNVSVSYLAAATDADYAPNIKKLVDNGCDIIVGVGFLINSAIVDAAKKNPSVKFAIVDQDGEDHGADGSVYPGKKIANLKPLQFSTNELHTADSTFHLSQSSWMDLQRVLLTTTRRRASL